MPSPAKRPEDRRPRSSLHPSASRLGITCLALVLGSATLLSGCAVAVLGGAAAVGASAYYDRRGAEVVLEDERLELAATSALAEDPEIRNGARIAVTSYNHLVLLTGQADSPDIARRAAEIVSRLPLTKRVVDEVSVGPPTEVARRSEDAYITSRSKVALLNVRLPGFNPIHVKVVTEDGVVFLLGLVTQEEAEAVTQEIRYIRGVKRVVKLFEYRDAHG